MAKVIPFFIGSFILLILAHYVYRWDRNHRDPNFPVTYNIDGKRVYMPPESTGIHIVITFICTILLFVLIYIGYFFHRPVETSNLKSYNYHPLVKLLEKPFK